MTSILRRLTLIVKVWMNKLLAPAQDPRQVFADAYQRQQVLLLKVRQAMANVTASKQQIVQKREERDREAKTVAARGKLPQMEDQARQALAAGREDQARFVLRLRRVAADELEALDKQEQELQNEERVLSLVEQRLAAQIETFFARQEVIAARYSTAEAHVGIQEALTGVSEELKDLGIALERAEERTEDMQARATAIDELVESGILQRHGERSGEDVLKELSAGDESAAVEDDLAALKEGQSLG